MIASNFITHPVRYENLGVFSLLPLTRHLSSYGFPSNNAQSYRQTNLVIVNLHRPKTSTNTRIVSVVHTAYTIKNTFVASSLILVTCYKTDHKEYNSITS